MSAGSYWKLWARSTGTTIRRGHSACLAHGRRNFVEVTPSFPDECRFVLETLGEVYGHDDQTRTQCLSPQQRLHFHQEHSGPVMEKQRVLAMQDRFLQCPLHQIIVQRCSRFPQKQREFLPVIEQIRDRLTQTEVRLYFPFRELRATPDLQLFHDRPAMLLMEGEALFGRQALRPRLIVR